MTNGTDSPRNVDKYVGPDYSFAPRYLRKRDPTPLTINVDLRPKEQQGYYPIGSFWINTVDSNVWVLSNIVTVTSGGVTGPAPDWVLIASDEDIAVKFAVPNGTSPVDPTAAGLFNLTSSDGSVTITGSPNTINFTTSSVATGIQRIAVDTGMSPVSGATVTSTNTTILATGTLANALQTNGLSGSSFAYQTQYAGSNAAVSAASKWGVAQFDSNSFTVASGFVTINNAGTTGVVTKIQGDDSLPVVPAAGLITLDGVVVNNATHAKPVFFAKNAASVEELDVQRTVAVTSGAKTANNAGLASFDSAIFTVDAATGWVSLVGGSLPPVIKFTADSGANPVLPNGAGNVNVLGSGSITTVASANTITTQLTGLTNHAVLVGAGTATITKVGPTATAGQVLQSQGAAADPVFSTATYPSTTTINQILYSSANNTVTGLTAANNSVLTSGATGIPTWTNMATNGVVLIGATGAPPSPATLTAGSGITITNGANSITIAATAAAFNWTDEAVPFNASSNNGYFITAGSVTATLPASPNQGDIIRFIVDTASAFTVTANSGQVIRLSSSVSASAGTAVSTARGDSLNLVYRSGATGWLSFGSIGNWVIT